MAMRKSIRTAGRDPRGVKRIKSLSKRKLSDRTKSYYLNAVHRFIEENTVLDENAEMSEEAVTYFLDWYRRKVELLGEITADMVRRAMRERGVEVEIADNRRGTRTYIGIRFEPNRNFKDGVPRSESKKKKMASRRRRVPPQSHRP